MVENLNEQILVLQHQMATVGGLETKNNHQTIDAKLSKLVSKHNTNQMTTFIIFTILFVVLFVTVVLCSIYQHKYFKHLFKNIFIKSDKFSRDTIDTSNGIKDLNKTDKATSSNNFEEIPLDKIKKQTFEDSFQDIPLDDSESSQEPSQTTAVVEVHNLNDTQEPSQTTTVANVHKDTEIQKESSASKLKQRLSTISRRRFFTSSSRSVEFPPRVNFQSDNPELIKIHTINENEKN